jgi:Tyrosine-protein kinase ephrin type A/B receptor-like
LCPSGSQSGVGEKECHTCSPGENFDVNIKVCIKCTPSFYSSNPSMVCTKCPAGQYTDTVGAVSCLSCPPSTPVNDAQTACTVPDVQCPQGQYLDKPNKLCVTCAPGSYTIDQSIPCKPCPYQHYTPPNAEFTLPYGTCTLCDRVMTPDKTECVRCPASFFRQVYVTALSTSNATRALLSPPPPPSKCVKCPTRYYSGNWESWDTECHYCERQWKINDEQTDCDREYYTPPPSYSPTLSPTDHGNCRRGQYEVHMNSSTSVGCIDCPGGTYSPYPLIGCKQCPPGLWSSKGFEKCLACGPGTVVSIDQDKCIPVPTTSPTPSPTSRCQPGQYDNLILDRCVSCLQGTYSPLPSTPCRNCPIGKYSPTIGASECTDCSGIVNIYRYSCTPCEASYYLKIERLDTNGPEYFRECRKCPKAQYSLKNDMCHDCPKGYTANAAQTGCEIIIPTFAPTPAPDFKCPPGQYLPIIDTYYCTRCLPSFYQPIVHTPCIKCPPGKYSVDGETTCHQCPLGTTVGPNQNACIADPSYN